MIPACRAHVPGPTTYHPATRTFERRCQVCGRTLTIITREFVEAPDTDKILEHLAQSFRTCDLKSVYDEVVKKEKSNHER